MAEPFIGELRMFAGTFEPVGWGFCDGRELQIAEHDVLYQLIGTMYGGNGVTTFRLPDLRGRVPLHAGPGHQLASLGGVETVTLTASQLPPHTHGLPVSSTPAGSRSAVGGVPAAAPSEVVWSSEAASEPMATTTPAGGSQPHDNMQPYLGINFILALYGAYPPMP
ncbi:phage tail protein [Nocardioides sp. SYSU D00065]|uniref:phage tail protein n=1 Tax=Nocardioides sp. SYSU D00065 TaxID=2817378 RepID=UPI001B331BB0|nr:tail fiber protein [Nocardioides sp. SYSU D00065]